jgi:hypothetical protein
MYDDAFMVLYTTALILPHDCFFLEGPWQVMLKQADGSYVCVAESPDRFTLGQVTPSICLFIHEKENVPEMLAYLIKTVLINSFRDIYL